VDILDVSILASAYGSQQGMARYNPAVDLNADGRINIFDPSIMAVYYGTTVSR